MSKINEKIIGNNARKEEHSMKNLTIKEKATIEANGKLNSRRCKPVICIDTGAVYTSATDAAEANETTIWSISTACLGKNKTAKGKRYCYVQDFPEHLADITARIASMHATQSEMEKKAAAYDAFMAEQEAKRKAEERRMAEITKANEKLERQRKIRERIEAELRRAIERETETENYLNELKGKEM